jgi:hypothetical protein
MKNSLIFLNLILISSLGPYIGFGFRIEHLVIYSLFFLVLTLFFNGLTVNKSVFYLCIPLFFSFVVTISFDLITGEKVRDGNVFSSVDNLLQSTLLIFIFSFLIGNSFDEEKFEKILILFVKISFFAGIISILTIFIDLEFLLKYFVSITDDEDNLWKQVMSLGRYTGIFSQPLEAGIYFSCSLFSLIYLNKKCNLKGFYFWGLFVVIFTAGIITLSKNFYLLGIVMAFVFYGQLSKWPISKYFLILVSFVSILMIVFIFVISDFGNYFNSLLSLYETNGLASAVTAGRFGGSESTDVEILFNQFYRDGLFMGFGLGTHLPLDNGFLEYAYQGGVLSLLGYMCFILLGFFKSLNKRHKSSSLFLRILVLYVFLSSIGGPVITANRANIIIVFLICATVALSNKTSNFYVNQ